MTKGRMFARYLPVESWSIDWGVHVLDAGYGDIEVGQEYPRGEHPASYWFSWDKGRVLDEYQVLYITKGGGVFETQKSGAIEVKSGDLIFLYPGVWHRYKPSEKTGWDESWIGFAGDYASRIMEKFFSEKRPVLTLGYDEELLRQIRLVAEYMDGEPPGFRQMIAGQTIAALARIRSLNMRTSDAVSGQEQRMNEARYYLLQHMTEEVDLEELAKDLGFSYSRFRTIFKKHTGSSPLQYQLNIRLNRAKELLRETDSSVSEIADELGFGSVYYFSRMFKKRLGKTPTQYRNS